MSGQFWWGVFAGSLATWSAAVTVLVIAAAAKRKDK